MSGIIDISLPLHPDLPVWPGGHGIRISRLMNISQGDTANVSRLDIDIHSGTHIDAPLHFIEGGKTTAEIPLEWLIGPCLVADMRGKKAITAADLEGLSLPDQVERILFRTDNSLKWADLSHPFDPDYCALTADAAQWVADRRIRLVGIDYHSIQRFHDPVDTHIILLSREVVILEGLDLRQAAPGWYKLTCLPVKIWGMEGASARAVLEPLAG